MVLQTSWKKFHKGKGGKGKGIQKKEKKKQKAGKKTTNGKTYDSGRGSKKISRGRRACTDKLALSFLFQRGCAEVKESLKGRKRRIAQVNATSLVLD